MREPTKYEIEKDPTRVDGFEFISYGGLPQGRTVIVSANSAKTIFASQFLAKDIFQYGQAGVFVTSEESPSDIRRTLLGFGWNISQWEADESGSFHNKQIHEFTIDNSELHIGRPFRHITGILKGNSQPLSSHEMDRLARLFEKEISE